MSRSRCTNGKDSASTYSDESENGRFDDDAEVQVDDFVPTDEDAMFAWAAKEGEDEMRSLEEAEKRKELESQGLGEEEAARLAGAIVEKKQEWLNWCNDPVKQEEVDREWKEIQEQIRIKVEKHEGETGEKISHLHLPFVPFSRSPISPKFQSSSRSNVNSC